MDTLIPALEGPTCGRDAGIDWSIPARDTIATAVMGMLAVLSCNHVLTAMHTRAGPRRRSRPARCGRISDSRRRRLLPGAHPCPGCGVVAGMRRGTSHGPGDGSCSVGTCLRCGAMSVGSSWSMPDHGKRPGRA